jgi:DNA-binding response OmpR family regulator
MAKIMIVDDDAELSDNLSACLQQAGHTVATVDTTGKVMATLATFQPELLILDMMFPEDQLGGFTVAHQIRHNPQFASLPIILLTDVNQHFPLTFPTDPAHDCRPIQDFMEKPVQVEELLSRIREVLQKPTPACTTCGCRT